MPSTVAAAAATTTEEELDNPTNPFEGDKTSADNTASTTENNSGGDDDDDDDDSSVHSAASVALREDFVRRMSQSVNGDNIDNNDNEEEDALLATATSTTPGLPSLAMARTTPRICWALLPFLCIVAHALFALGQTLPMWRLSLVAEDINVWANATTEASRTMYKALGFHDQYGHFEMHQNKTVETFTYGFAVQELWEAKGMPGTTVPRIAAGLLVLASGIWPHLKLVLLQISWWTNGRIAQAPKQRTRMLGWLALLGKWSLADVLVVCVMVGVLHLEWVLDPVTMKDGIKNNLQQILEIIKMLWGTGDICTHFLDFDAHDCGAVGVLHKPSCFTCKRFVHVAFTKANYVEKLGKPLLDGIDTSGGGHVTLSVVGMEGIYFFCAAVCLSVLLSVMVEWYDHRYLESLRQEYRRQGYTSNSTSNNRRNHHSLSLSSNNATGDEEQPALSSNVSDISEPLLGPNDNDNDEEGFQNMEIMEDEASVLSYVIQRTTSSPAYRCFQCEHILPIVSVAFVYLAIYLPSMERHVGGAIPKLMKEILGVDLDKTYSLQTLKETCGKAGGWDLFLQATFGLFIVVGPLMRVVLVFVVAMSRSSGSSTQRIRSLLVAASNFLAAFCAWEVFLAGLVMVGLIMPSATSTILMKDECVQLSGDGTNCLQVDFMRVPAPFACLVIGFVLVGGLAIHVSLEDANERFLLENHEDAIAAAGPDGVTANGQYYVEVASGDDDDNNNINNNELNVSNDISAMDGDDPRRTGGNNESGEVATMIEEEAV